MEPFYDDGKVSLYCGDAIDVLRQFPAECFDSIVTSPPYYSLRDYGIGKRVWGGNEDCAHEWVENVSAEAFSSKRRWQHTGGRKGLEQQGGFTQLVLGESCPMCGAWRGALGLEPTPELYVQHIVEVFRECRRVLSNRGTLWLNIGDTYATVLGKKLGNYKSKDLIGIPWMVAFALRADGWYLRQDIIWHKTNPMPESVKDRFTKAHEYVFLFSKNKDYYFNEINSREVGVTPPQKRSRQMVDKTPSSPEYRTRAGLSRERELDGTRKKRSVWEIPTQPYKGAHFAVFPERLAAQMVAIGTPAGGCVLDPFVGSGTVPMVARAMGRCAVGIDASADYLRIAKLRINSKPLPLPLPEQPALPEV